MPPWLEGSVYEQCHLECCTNCTLIRGAFLHKRPMVDVRIVSNFSLQNQVRSLEGMYKYGKVFMRRKTEGFFFRNFLLFSKRKHSDSAHVPRQGGAVAATRTLYSPCYLNETLKEGFIRHSKLRLTVSTGIRILLRYGE